MKPTKEDLAKAITSFHKAGLVNDHWLIQVSGQQVQDLLNQLFDNPTPPKDEPDNLPQ